MLGGQLLEDALRDFEAPDGDAFYWIANRRARMMRKFVEGRLNVPKEWIRATRYWKAGGNGNGLARRSQNGANGGSGIVTSTSAFSDM